MGCVLAEGHPPTRRGVVPGLIALGLFVLIASVLVALRPYQWPLVGAGSFVLGLAAVYVFSLKRRWPVLVSVVVGFLAAFVLFMPIGCLGEASSGADVRTICHNIVGQSLPGFSGRGPRFSPSYQTPLAAGGLAALLTSVVDRRRRRRGAS
jgi:hypothetical protein